jgi:hypothetical protein
MHTPSQQSSILDGESLSLGGLYWPRPYFPTRVERAKLVSMALPEWATPSGTTAAWIWTGMGSPTPLTVLRPSHPAISPIERERWRAKELRDSHHKITTVGGYRVLDPLSTEEELFRHTHTIDSSATQILFLRALGWSRRSGHTVRMSDAQRERAGLIRDRIHELEDRYPDITR